jgi:cytosolic iron-sulfur protein assembly protein CIAO1
MLSLQTTLIGHDARVWHAAWSPDGSKIASCGEDKIIRIWASNSGTETVSFTCISTLEEGQTRTIRSCEWSPDGTLVASASFDGSVVVWQSLDRSFRKWEKIAALEGHDSEVKCVSWSSDGNFVATCGRDKKVWVWERLLSGDFECAAMLDGHTQDVKFLKWHPTANVLFSCGYDDTIKVWLDDNDEWYCSSTWKGHTSTVWGISLDSTGGRLLSVSADQSAILWEAESSIDPAGEWRQITALSGLHTQPIYSVDWSAENGVIVTGGGDNAIKLLQYSRSTDDGGTSILQELYALREAHEGDINCVRWRPRPSPSSSVTGADAESGDDPTAGESGTCPRTGTGSASEVDNYASYIMSAGDDGVIKIWKFEPV